MSKFPTLNGTEINLLRSKWQRPNLYVALFGVYGLEVRTDIKDATKERTYNPNDWQPVVNIGPHRLGFVGEQMTFDAQDSYKMIFDGGGKRRRAENHAQGYGSGDNMGMFSWKIQSDTGYEFDRLGQRWNDTIAWTPPAAGLYTVSVGRGHGDDALAKRWIRVYTDRETPTWNVTAIEGLTGEWGGGWTSTLTVQTSDFSLTGDAIQDYQAVGVYCEDYWWNGAIWVHQDIGMSRQDPKAVIIGYVKERTIQKKSDANTVQFTIESITGQMDRSQSHKVAIWRGEGPPDDSGTEVDVPSRELQECRQSPHKQRCRRRKKRQDDNNNGVDTWGSILKGFGRVCVSDFALWFLQFKTNILLWHDFYAVWNENMADLESIAGEETSVLSNLQTVGDNDWVKVGAMADGAIYFCPDRQVLKDEIFDVSSNLIGGWEYNWTIPRMTFTDDEIWELGLTVKKEKPIKFVKLTATKTADFQSDAKRRRKQRKQEKKNQIEATYPGEDPDKYTPGEWFVRSDLLHDNERVIKDRAVAVFNQMNTVWTGIITTGLNRSCHPGFVIDVNPTKNDSLWGAGSKRFIVSNYSANIDPANRSWNSVIELEEFVP